MRAKVFVKTFGCQMNEYDSDKMVGVLDAAYGCDPTEDAAQADVILLNTCSVREKAQEKVFHQLGRWRELKRENPNLLIGVGGCVASQEGAAIVRRAPFVDFVFGPQTLHRIPQLIDARRASGRPQIDISFPEIEKFDALPPARVEGPSAFVSIMEGCSKYCSFCVVPYTRGEEFSRPLADCLAEITELAARGVKEVTLLGQNVNAYRDPADDGEIDFALLLHYVAAMPGIERIRYTTSHPVEFSQTLIDAYATIPKLVDQVHLPVQSGSDRILAAMKRGYTTLEYKSIVRRLRKVRPSVTISSDFIVGFPGETDADFEATIKLVEEVGFDHSYSFLYSARPGTPAAALADETPLEIKQQRLARLQALLDIQGCAVTAGMVGRRERVLVTGRSPKYASQLSARASNNRVVNFDGDAHLIGQYVEVAISAAMSHSLQGKLLTSI